MESLEVVLHGEFVAQVIPVCSILAGFTMVTVLLENRGAPDSTRGIIVGVLSIASVAFFCATCASAMYLYRLGLPEAAIEYHAGTEGELGTARVADLLDERAPDGGSGFGPLLIIVVCGSTLGGIGVLGAIGLSGFVRGNASGLLTAGAAGFGGLVLLYGLMQPW